MCFKICDLCCVKLLLNFVGSFYFQLCGCNSVNVIEQKSSHEILAENLRQIEDFEISCI